MWLPGSVWLVATVKWWNSLNSQEKGRRWCSVESRGEAGEPVCDVDHDVDRAATWTSKPGESGSSRLGVAATGGRPLS